MVAGFGNLERGKERDCLFCEIANEREIEKPFLGFETKEWEGRLPSHIWPSPSRAKALNEPQLAIGPG